jgi:hypothetical protein
VTTPKGRPQGWGQPLGIFVQPIESDGHRLIELALFDEHAAIRRKVRAEAIHQAIQVCYPIRLLLNEVEADVCRNAVSSGVLEEGLKGDDWGAFLAAFIFPWPSEPVDKENPAVLLAHDREPRAQISAKHFVLPERMRIKGPGDRSWWQRALPVLSRSVTIFVTFMRGFVQCGAPVIS